LPRPEARRRLSARSKRIAAPASFRRKITLPRVLRAVDLARRAHSFSAAGVPTEFLFCFYLGTLAASVFLRQRSAEVFFLFACRRSSLFLHRSTEGAPCVSRSLELLIAVTACAVQRFAPPGEPRRRFSSVFLRSRVFLPSRCRSSGIFLAQRDTVSCLRRCGASSRFLRPDVRCLSLRFTRGAPQLGLGSWIWTPLSFRHHRHAGSLSRKAFRLLALGPAFQLKSTTAGFSF
jgi:hypothetical protein